MQRWTHNTTDRLNYGHPHIQCSMQTVTLTPQCTAARPAVLSHMDNATPTVCTPAAPICSVLRTAAPIWRVRRTAPNCSTHLQRMQDCCIRPVLTRVHSHTRCAHYRSHWRGLHGCCIRHWSA
eukprot:scaffold112302_cov27-Tisochrysis_lutea.AAC.1